jgi:hypothetical protein
MGTDMGNKEGVSAPPNLRLANKLCTNQITTQNILIKIMKNNVLFSNTHLNSKSF